MPSVRMQNVIIALGTLFCLLTATAPAPAGMIDLGTLGGNTGAGNFSYAYSINNSGQVVGESTTDTGETHAFMYSSGIGMTDLNINPLKNVAYGINNNGQIAGWFHSNADYQTYAFRYSSEYGVLTNLGYLDGGPYSEARGINSGGQVVGHSGIDGHDRAFLWSVDGGMIDLDRLPGGNDSYATGINSSSQIVGYSTVTDGNIHAFLWSADGGMVDLGTLGGSYSKAYGINDRGQVVGWSHIANGQARAFLWSDGVMTPLGTLGGTFSEAYGINSKGQVVGSSTTSDGQQHACLWSDGAIIDLGSLGGRSWAYSINDLGQVVGYSETGEEMHAFLYTPNPVPAPASLLLLGSGLLGLAGWRRLRKV